VRQGIGTALPDGYVPHVAVEHLDVVVVGAGLSGVGAACRLEQLRAGTSYAVLEARDAIGGTWDLFRYPGIRSDSDMLTLGYPFRPWTRSTPLADGPTIKRYIEDTAREYDVERHIRFGHRVVAGRWSSDDARWTLEVALADGARTEITCSFLYACTGYYRYDRGHEPDIPGREDYRGVVVHPQLWPDDLDVAGRRVVVVGSGATAVTLVPSLAATAEHVVMLQRSPTYITALPSRDRIAEALRRVLPEQAAYRAARAKSIGVAAASYRASQRWPSQMRALLMSGAAKQLPPGYDVERHFGPSYGPWDQRLCVVPDGDLFTAVSSGRASVVTDRIARYTATGLLLESGEELEADVVVTATGLELQLLGGTVLEVDGVPVQASGTVAYKGLMLSGIPNFAFAVGYTNASWTLKCDLVSRYVCRVLSYMHQRRYDVVMPVAPPEPDRAPLIDLSSGYVARAAATLPQQGVRPPWRLHQSYYADVRMLTRQPVDDEGVVFSRTPGREARGAVDREAR
jgi:cation diffusion facilitator CzcD-associated flavoprotein CzcO